MARVVIRVDELTPVVEGLAERVQDFSVPLRAWGVYMVGSVNRNFQAQGRPERWAPLKLKTLMARVTRGNRTRRAQKKVLKALGGSKASRFRSAVVSGALGGTARAPLGSTFTAVATRALLSGKILIDRGFLKSSIVSALVGNMRVAIGTNLKYAAYQNFGATGTNRAGKRMNNPARPFLVIQDEDERVFGELVREWLQGGFGRVKG